MGQVAGRLGYRAHGCVQGFLWVGVSGAGFTACAAWCASCVHKVPRSPTLAQPSEFGPFWLGWDHGLLFSTRLAETTIDNNNVTLWQYVTPSSVLEWARSMVASRLATTGEEWTSTFSRYNSGYVVHRAQYY